MGHLYIKIRSTKQCEKKLVIHTKLHSNKSCMPLPAVTFDDWTHKRNQFIFLPRCSRTKKVCRKAMHKQTQKIVL